MTYPNIKRTSLPKRLAVSSAIAAAMMTGYIGRSAYAGSCANTGGGSYLCAGAAGADTTQTLTPATGGLTITTSSDFGITTAKGDALHFELSNLSADDLNFDDGGDTNAITGYQNGIYAKNDGGGKTLISVSGVVKGGTIGAAIDVSSGALGGQMVINAKGDLTGSSDGIYAIQGGNSGLSIDTAGTVKGGNGRGIYGQSASSLTINTTGQVIGQREGILATNGSGPLSVTTSDTITSTQNRAIHAFSGGLTTNTTINTNGNVAAYQDGVYARHGGSGDLLITTVGTVVSGIGWGIGGISDANTQRMIINTLENVSGTAGVLGRHEGEGLLSITTAPGKVITASLETGIEANSRQSDLIVAAGSVISSGRYGISAESAGKGDITITSTANITSKRDGIKAYNSNLLGTGKGEISIQAEGQIVVTNASYADPGIEAISKSSGGIDITVSNVIDPNISGGMNLGTGIVTSTPAGVMTTINLNSGADVKDGITNLGDGDANITVNGDGIVSGDIALYAGGDTLTFNGSDLSNITLFDGGAGNSDTLALNDINASLDGAIILGWETIGINANSVISFNSTPIVTGEVLNSGTINMQDSSAGDIVTIDGNYTANGTLALDVQLDTGTVDVTDMLIITADSIGAGAIAVNHVGGVGALTTGDGIKVVQVNGTTSWATFSLTSPVIAGDFVYDLAQVGKDWYLQSCQLGDADGNSVVDVRDIVKTINMALGNEVTTICADFDQPANGVTILDVLATVDVVLGN